ncbi:hypothetical protein RND71_002918 [Anisodus tanguticus]|uniref:PROP1-like PPR domain-containing protein n=1 Tax=Anisodus tanguticus TaxID=243964 RepID=A0AAE1SWY9_9SOLA|nr:hypothetical protein RND71_002918 [Anisodus tanguticus]
MIGGRGMHGQIDDAISLFHEMANRGIKPNYIIITNILSACSHAGYLDEGKYFFNLMIELAIEPKPEHFACLVDLLSRAGDIDKAYEVITSMPFPADVSLWGALVNGCRIHNRLDIIKMIQQRLESLQTDDTGYYTLLSNIYAEGGEWNESRVVRSKMRSLGLRKVDGYSMIEVEKRIHTGSELQMIADAKIWLGGIAVSGSSGDFLLRLPKVELCLLRSLLLSFSFCQVAIFSWIEKKLDT